MRDCQVLYKVVPDDASVEKVEFSEDGVAVALWTLDVGLFLGQREVSAERNRTAIGGELHRNSRLIIEEVFPSDRQPPAPH